MEIELLSRETIKPSSPTPSHLKLYPLSFIDNIIFRNYAPLLYFYNPNKSIDQNSKISQLRKSLSQLLSKYYPFAGRIKDRITIECNDQGVLFLVTKIKNKLSEILQNPTEKLLNPLFPDELQWKEMDWRASFIAIQINWFTCGGMVISICMTHKIGDASTIFKFMNDWAIINQKIEEDKKELLVSPLSLLDAGATIFPQRDLPIFPEMVIKKENNVVFKRFVFQPAMIKSLKAMVTSSSMHSPTQVQVVTAWIYKHAVSIMGLNFQTAMFSMIVDLRRRMVPPLSEHCVGNIFWFSSMLANKKEMELEDLVCQIKEGLSECCNVYPKLFREKENNNISECLKQVTEPYSENKNLFTFSSWCRFPMYEADFGWGKPIWITTTGLSSRNIIFLMDTRDGDGIEAIVNMEDNYMAKFEHEFELLQYASFNPNNARHDVIPSKL
ncbi:putative vinorine synthase [Medicago truncatula]|uniref:Anthranilate N-benzoyltransferase n=1 Tax=Medicago truncatula TaxID=3880 RepID=G7K7H3_MEDTR|nr:stemmadenine O-acetyltransferase [Medicago truncatula]AES99803.1 anthranilate N-benzoyltransferase [Medicago truncatula]RHN57284.1 putative vinorine synthase [Medicago truncatula]